MPAQVTFSIRTWSSNFCRALMAMILLWALQVQARDTTLPKVSITSPKIGTSVAAGQLLSIAIAATDNIKVKFVQVYVNDTFLCTDTTKPYSCNYSVPATGLNRFSVQALAVDSSNLVGYSGKMYVDVPQPPQPQPQPAVGSTTPSTRYFGYVGIDCGISYLSEVASYTNLNHTCVYGPESIVARLQSANSRGTKAFVDLHFLLFQMGGTPGGSGSGFDLRPDYQTRWSQFISNNPGVLNSTYIGAFYIAEEPTWLGISSAELQTVASMIRRDMPGLPLALIEAHQALDGLVVPLEVDWVGMDFYGAIDPRNTTEFQEFEWLNAQFASHYSQLKAKRSRADQKVILVFDGQWADLYGSVGYPQESLATFVRNYYLLMQSDPDVIAMLGYAYFSGLDSGFIGLRDLPQVVKDANIEVGKAITGKP